MSFKIKLNKEVNETDDFRKSDDGGGGSAKIAQVRFSAAYAACRISFGSGAAAPCSNLPFRQPRNITIFPKKHLTSTLYYAIIFADNARVGIGAPVSLENECGSL